jgi:hypothetical protein
MRPAEEVSLRRLLAGCCLLATLAEAYQVRRNNGVEDGSKLIRIVGDVIFGGIFPMHEQVRRYAGADSSSQGLAAPPPRPPSLPAAPHGPPLSPQLIPISADAPFGLRVSAAPY